jgi:ubiquinone/menaquinone biosynthesis C-methylase UbiE
MENRETGLERLTAEGISLKNQHYIGTSFIRDDIEFAAQKFATGVLLDIGCGNKPYQNIFQNKVTKYVGCDIAQSSLNIVDNICPADNLVYDDNFFDTVFSTQVLEHVGNFNGMISEAYRVLKPGGYGIFTAPFCWELHEEPYDFFRYSKYGFTYSFEQKGFEVIEVKSNGGKWAAIFQLFLNVLFSTRRFNTLRSRIIKLLFIHLRMIYLYNRFAVWLDKRFPDDILTLNYLTIVRKPVNGNK